MTESSTITREGEAEADAVLARLAMLRCHQTCEAVREDMRLAHENRAMTPLLPYMGGGSVA